MLLPLLLILPLWASPAGAHGTSPSAVAPQRGAEEDSLDALEDRDRRLSFGRGSAERARRFLRALEGGERQPSGDALQAQAAALVAIGAGGGPGDVALLEAFAGPGKLSLRRAAILGLGDLGDPGYPALERVLRGDTTGLERSLQVALEGAPGPRAAVLRGSLGERQTEALVDPTRRQRLELRWEAARRFGFIDGRRFEELQLDRLFENEAFLDRFVLAQIQSLEPDIVQAHLMEALARPDRAGALGALMRSMPRAMTQILGSGTRELSSDEWTAVLDEVDEQRAWRSVEGLLGMAARAEPQVRERAMVQLVRGGHETPGAWLRGALLDPSPELQRALLEAAGDSHDAERIPDVQRVIARFVQSRFASVGLVALARMGHEPSRLELDAILEGGPSPERARAIGALVRVAYDAFALERLRAVAERTDLSETEREQILLGYLEAGQLPDRAALRHWLVRHAAGHPLAARVVRGLSRRPEGADVALFEELFPLGLNDPGMADPGMAGERDPRALAMNVELALALHRQHDPVGGRILRAALWSSDWNRSALAGGLLVESSGMQALLFELEAPPARVGREDLRRVGFAIGEFGGLPALEHLGRTRDERDPALQGAFLGALSARNQP